MAKYDFNRDWKFRKQKNGEEIAVNLPHDAMIHEERDPKCKNGKTTGYYPGGTYWYRKCFCPDEAWKDRVLLLELEGVYHNAEVWVNQEKAAEHPNGYTGFTVELQNLKFGEENEIEIFADTSGEPNTRWYSGSGIYRPVWLHVLDPVHILPDGVWFVGNSVSGGRTGNTCGRKPADQRMAVFGCGTLLVVGRTGRKNDGSSRV